MKVRGTQEVVKPLEQDQYKVYIRTNIVRIDEEDTEETPGFHGWEYDEIEMTIPEYQAMVKGDVEKLKEEDLNNKMALTEIFEMLIV
jgi:hypothetical protein